MGDAAAISGDFATYKHIQGRKVLQLVIEVPAEMASAVFAALGTPGSGEGIPVAVARLQTAPEPIAKPEPPKERRPFSELPYSQQAAMRSNDPGMWAFFRGKGFTGCVNADDAAHAIRMACAVDSRSEIIKGTPAGDKWEALEAEYYVWQRGMR